MRVTLDIYSGSENPSWDLSESDARQLVNRLAGKTVAAVNEVEGVLGFRGYIISVADDADETASAAGLPSDFRIGGTLPQQFLSPEAAEPSTLSPAEVEDAAQWLLTTAQQAVDEEIVTIVQGAIRQEPQPQLEPAVAAACVIQNTPYNPGFWNTPSVQPLQQLLQLCDELSVQYLCTARTDLGTSEQHHAMCERRHCGKLGWMHSHLLRPQQECCPGHLARP